MELNLTGRVAVVTGASKGIGLAVTRALAGEGAQVVAGARAEPAGLAELGAAVLPVRVDLSTPDAVAKQAAADSVTGRFTRPEEVGDLVLMLASGRAGNVTGADFVIDRGMVSTL